MPKKTFTPEQIVPKLRQIEVLIGQGKAVPLACKEAGITAQTFYRWRKEYGGLQLEQAKKLKDLQKEIAQLKRALATVTLERQILKDIAEGNFKVPCGDVSPFNTHGTRDSVNGMPALQSGSGALRSVISRRSATTRIARRRSWQWRASTAALAIAESRHC